MTRTAKMKPVKAWACIMPSGEPMIDDDGTIILYPVKQSLPPLWRIARVQITELHPEQRRRKL